MQSHQAEFNKCATDILYFANNHVIISGVDKGDIQPLKLYQEEVLRDWAYERFNMLAACRQSGKTTMINIFALWTALFKRNQSVFIFVGKEDMGRYCLGNILRMYDLLPDFLRPVILMNNDRELGFNNGSRISVTSAGPYGICGVSPTCALLDELAFVEPRSQYELYEGLLPMLSSRSDSKCIIASTPNGNKNHFSQLWHSRRFSNNMVTWQDVAPYQRDGWKEEMRHGLGNHKTWRQEFCCDFI